MIERSELPYYAESLDDLQKQIIMHCTSKKSLGYARISENLGVDYEAVQIAGRMLQGAELATISHVRHGREFAGSALFLTPKGEAVREILIKAQRI